MRAAEWSKPRFNLICFHQLGANPNYITPIFLYGHQMLFILIPIILTLWAGSVYYLIDNMTNPNVPEPLGFMAFFLYCTSSISLAAYIGFTYAK